MPSRWKGDWSHLWVHSDAYWVDLYHVSLADGRKLQLTDDILAKKDRLTHCHYKVNTGANLCTCFDGDINHSQCGHRTPVIRFEHSGDRSGSVTMSAVISVRVAPVSSRPVHVLSFTSTCS